LSIAVLSDLETIGGAAVATSRLARGLATAGHDVTRLVHVPNGRESVWKVRKLAGAQNLRRFAYAAFKGGITTRLLRATVSAQLDRQLSLIKPDIVNIHNLHGAAWHPELAEVCIAHAPTVWTLHDMWSFTGRCAYSFECRKFESGCDSTCPTPHEYPSLPPSRIAAAWTERRQLFEMRRELCAVTPSRWLKQEATRGLWKGHRVEVIPYGLPLDVFHIEDRAVARARFRIRGDRPVLLMVAADLTERRKGGAVLLEALAHLNRPVTLLTIGIGELPASVGSTQVHALGHISNEHDVAWAYNAADLLVHPAPVDNLPNVILESIACGTPAVGFAVGGVPEIVGAGVTGWLADAVTPRALAEAIDLALDDLAKGVDLRASCRRVAELEYALDLQATRYTSLFTSLHDTARDDQAQAAAQRP
jgi:glycosyltransferase involved in cell wall biosynthesis